MLSVLLLGLVPVTGGSVSQVGIDTLSVAPPSLFSPVVSKRSHLMRRHLSASGMIIVDLQSGEKLSALNGSERRPVGSLTKLMTALIIVENHHLDEEVTVPKDLPHTPGTSTHLPEGQRFTVGDLLSAMLIASANDAAETLARYHSGSSENFVRLMNERATTLGLRDTSYANPVGLDAVGGWSTPQDIAWLTLFTLRFSDIRTRMATASQVIRSREGTTIALIHTHALMRTAPPSYGGSPSLSPRVIAGKTGTTDGAGQCLLSVVQQGNHKYLVVLLDSAARYEDMKTILQSLRSPSA